MCDVYDVCVPVCEMYVLCIQCVSVYDMCVSMCNMCVMCICVGV